MRPALVFAAVLALLLTGLPLSAGAQAARPAEPQIDVPVVLKQANVVFNMDHLAFAGEMPVGLGYMQLMAKDFAAMDAKWKIVAIFHGAAGYMLLNDAAYNRVR